MTQATLVERHAAMRDRFFGAGLLIPSGVDGVYGRSADFEHVVSGLKRAVHVFAAVDGAENFEFPPIIPRATFERIGYLRNFPQLAGPVFSFQGGERDFQALLKTLDDEQPYGEHLSQTEVVLVPACCYPVYPMLTGTMAIDHKVVQTVAILLPARAISGSDAVAGVPSDGERLDRHARSRARVAQSLVGARSTAAVRSWSRGAFRRRQRSVLRSCRPPDVSQPARAPVEDRAARAGIR